MFPLGNGQITTFSRNVSLPATSKLAPPDAAPIVVLKNYRRIKPHAF